VNGRDEERKKERKKERDVKKALVY